MLVFALFQTKFRFSLSREFSDISTNFRASCGYLWTNENSCFTTRCLHASDSKVTAVALFVLVSVYTTKATHANTASQKALAEQLITLQLSATAMNTTATPPTLTPITTPPFTASTNTTLISPSPLYSSSTPTATNNVNNDTSLSLLQEILKQLHTLTKPPASTITRLQPVALDADGKQVVCTPPLPQPEPEFQVNTEKLAQLKDAFFGAGTSAELEEFLLMYLETMQICAYEYIELESSVQDLTKNLKDQQIKANKKKKRKRKNLSESSKNLLKKWLADHWVSDVHNFFLHFAYLCLYYPVPSISNKWREDTTMRTNWNHDTFA